MPTPRKPQDHKQSKAELARYTFEYKGKTYEMAEGASFEDVASPGFIRKNRKNDESDIIFNMLEVVYDEETLAETVDVMKRDEWTQFMEDFGNAFNEFNGATVGES